MSLPGGTNYGWLEHDPKACSTPSFLLERPAQELAIVSGDPTLERIAQGNGGFNTPWNWHLDPDTVSLPEVAIELCDGCPSDVEASGVNYGGGTFCPWTSEIIAEQN